MTQTVTQSTADQQVELIVGGMTCASCAARIEKKLNKLDGVCATVNYATEKATASIRPGIDPQLLIGTVENAGYTAVLPKPQPEPDEPGEVDSEYGLGTRLLVSSQLAWPVILVSMVPALQFPYWQWASLLFAVPVVTWGAWPFHRAAWTNLRHGSSTMDTLVSMGTLAALGWSLYALFFGDAGMIGMTHGFSFTGGGSNAIYFEVAAGVTTFCWPGAISRRGPSAARARLCGRCCRWVRRTWPSCGTAKSGAFRSGSSPSARNSSSGRGRRSRPMGSSSAAGPGWTPAWSPVSPCPPSSQRATPWSAAR
jgi:Cu+-exporting ATPase